MLETIDTFIVHRFGLGKKSAVYNQIPKSTN